MEIRKRANSLVAIVVAVGIVGFVAGCGNLSDEIDLTLADLSPANTEVPSIMNTGAVANDTSSPDVASTAANDSPRESASPISTEDILTMTDMEASGWKKSKQLDIGGLEGAKEVWYGFFNQKNIELWIYASSDDAVNFGAAAAQSILDEGRVVDVLNSIRGGTSVYSAYRVVGNVLMFCESADSCEILAKRVS